MPSSKFDYQLHRFTFQAMGSPCEIRIYDANKHHAQDVISRAVSRINALEFRYSRYRDDNLMHKVNRVAASGGVIGIDDEFEALLNYADACYQQSDGLFDVTSGVLRSAWNFSESQLISLPCDEDIKALLGRVGWQHVSYGNGELNFAKAQMEIDFGGIVKEYAADCAAKVLSDLGVQHGLVNLGGDIKAIGPHPNGDPWEIKVRDPENTGNHITMMMLHDDGLATSGDYERFVELGGRRYSHLLSPKTGWPVFGLASVTVKAPQCVVAGAAATIAMLKGGEGEEWLRLSGFECFSRALRG